MYKYVLQVQKKTTRIASRASCLSSNVTDCTVFNLPSASVSTYFFLLCLNPHLVDYTLNLIKNDLLYLLKNMIVRSRKYIHNSLFLLYNSMLSYILSVKKYVELLRAY